MNGHRIEGAVALVTGANRGIGRALTEALLTRGVRKVYATARNPEALSALRDERLVALRLDVTDAEQIRAAVEAASDVELVFNNAGVALAGGIAGAAVLDQARREMEVNYFGPLQLLRWPGAVAGAERRRRCRQHRLGRRPDQRPSSPNLQRVKGRSAFPDPGGADPPRGAGHVGLRRLRRPRRHRHGSRSSAAENIAERSGVRHPRRHRGRTGGHLPGSVRGGFQPAVRVLAEGLGTADGRHDRGDVIGLRGVSRTSSER